MASFVTLAGGSGTGSGTKTFTATPGVGDLIVFVTCHSGLSTSTPPTDNNSAGTYVLAGTVVKTVDTCLLEVWVRTSLITAAVSTIFTHAPGVTTGGGLRGWGLSGMTQVGSAAVRQVGSTADVAATSTPALTFPGAALTANPVIATLINGTNPPAVTAPAGFTATGFTHVWSTPSAGMPLSVRDSGFTSATLTWGSTTPSIASVVAVEFDASAAAGGIVRQMLQHGLYGGG